MDEQLYLLATSQKEFKKIEKLIPSHKLIDQKVNRRYHYLLFENLDELEIKSLNKSLNKNAVLMVSTQEKFLDEFIKCLNKTTSIK